MNSAGLHDRKFSGHFQLPTLNSEKLGSPDVDDRIHNQQPSSPLKKALDSPWTPKHNVNHEDILKYLNATTLFHYVVRFLYLLIPSFISSRLSRENAKVEKGHPTAYLDGMRGLAAFAVFLCHLSYGTWFITFGFGQGAEGENTYLVQLPIVRLFYSGPPMVSLFFVISGYALSYRPLRQMRARQYDGLLATMSSSVIRRPIRLFLPCFVSTFMIACMAQMGVYEKTSWFAHNMRAIYEDHPWTAPDLYTQLLDWYWKMFEFINCFEFNIFAGSPEHDRHLWTIPCEFRASMVLFLTHFMVARMQTSLRMLTILGLIWWGLRWNRWELCLFWSGCILAELDHVRIAHENAMATATHHPEVNKRSVRSELLWKWFWAFSFVSGLYLASYPDTLGEDTPGYRYLATLIPWYFFDRYRFWQCFAAVQIVWTVNHADFLKRPFQTPFVLYLGKISYAIYLMHGPVIHTFGYTIFPWVWSHTGVEDRWSIELGFFISCLFIIPVTIWAADVFWRLVDTPVVKFARWFESKLIVLP